MEKRLILAVGLSFLVIFAWSKFFPDTKEQGPRAALTSSPGKEVKDEAVLVKAPQAGLDIVSSSEFLLNTEAADFKFIEPQAAIKEVVFNKYQGYKIGLENSLIIDNKDILFKRNENFTSGAQYIFEDNNSLITKTIYGAKSNYTIDLEIKVKNKSQAVFKKDLALILGRLDFSAKAGDNQQPNHKDFIIATKDQIQYPNIKKDFVDSNVKFLGLRERYFCAIIQPEQEGNAGFIRKISPQKSEIGLVEKDIEVLPGEEITRKFSLFIGPQDVKIIKQVNPDWTAIVYYGKLDIIAHVLLAMLEFFYKIVHNWGWAIVMFSIAIYLILYPLSLKQMRSMKQMQAIQPKLEELRVKYKDDPQRFSREQILLFQEHKINPFSGCLVLILQMPIFFTLYQILTRTVMLKGTSFLWIKDLTLPDRLIIFPFSIPLLGNELNILPLFMSAGMYFQQKITYVPQPGSQGEQQKIMLILMPIILLFVFYRLPAGVNLYWVINNILMVIYQIRAAKAK